MRTSVLKMMKGTQMGRNKLPESEKKKKFSMWMDQKYIDLLKEENQKGRHQSKVVEKALEAWYKLKEK